MTIAKLALAALVLLVAVRPALAQSVEAEALFREGKELLKQGKLGEACAKFDASDRIEPSVGTELNAADCHEKNNKLATAWAGFLKAAGNAAKAGNDKQREAEAKRRASLLEPKLSYLTISVSESSRVTGLSIKRNGVDVDQALWNTGIPVDAGDYEIAGQAPGHEAWSTKVTVAVSERKSVEVPRFKEITALVTPPPDQNPNPLEKEPVEQPHETPSTFTPMRKAAIGAAAVGVIGIAGTVVFGLKANSKQSEAEDLCPAAPACADPMAIQLNDDARSAAKLSNVMLGVGVVGVGAAVALWFIGAPKEGTPNDVAIVPVTNGRDVGLSFSGSF
ncbi:MAG TPA: hypothetical protein VMZ53_11825 [Kofleriaceae bacterium]|nr:hypothetical protein [Kofleriaceae bacterium]